MIIISDAEFRSLSLREALDTLTSYCSKTLPKISPRTGKAFPRVRVGFSRSGWMSPSIASLSYSGVTFYMDPRKLGITATLVVLAHELGHIEDNNSVEAYSTGFVEVNAFKLGAHYAIHFSVIVEYIGYIRFLAAKYSRTEYLNSISRVIIPPNEMDSLADSLMQQYSISKAELWTLPAPVDLIISKWDAEYRRRMQ